MRRRAFVARLGGAAAAWPLVARSQQSAAMLVVGVLTPESPYSSGARNPLIEGLRELGYVEGRNIRIEYRWAQGNFAQLPGLAAELVRLKVDVIVTVVTQATLAARKETATIPIVMIGVADPVGVGLVQSLAHPGGNVTGTSSVATAVVGKQIELLKEVVPDASRIAVLWNPANPVFQAQQVKDAEIAANKIGVRLQLVEARSPDEFAAALATIERTRVLGILIDPLFATHIKALAALSLKQRLVSIFGSRDFADAGGLMAYGPNYAEIGKRSATYVDKILKGAKPSDLPVEQPTKFQFVVNLRTAKALGVDLPPSILAFADEVIE
jgi:putative tryptophan/tyrosine transport system substrate-binding protein